MNLINGTMRYIAYYLLLLAMKNIQIEGNTCLTDLPDHKPRYIHYNGRPMNFTLEISDRVSHRLTTEILKILLQDVLGYQNIMIVKDLQHLDISSWENLHEKYSEGPDVLINLETLVNPETGYKQLSEFMTECGNIGPPGRYGWFIPEQLYEMFPGSDHWKYFKNPSTAQNFDITRSEDLNLLHKYSFNTKNQKYICETNNCKDGYYVPQHCQGNQSCAVMLTSYPNTTNFIISQIDELKLYIKILWLGNNLRNVVDKLTNIYKDQNVNKSIIFLEWSPGIFTTELEKFNMVSIPNCDYFKNPSSSGCQYEMTQTIKTSWKELQNVAWPAFELINKMHFDMNTYKKLLQLYNQNGNSSFQKTACMWIKNNKPLWSTWLSTRSDKKNLYVGGIFPITGSLYNAYGIVIAAKMAENAINANSTILADYQLNLLVNDGMCKADMVMKTFIDYIYHNTYENLIGVLGPACSETVEPLAGVSKHYSTLVISYSAEGSSFSDRSRYPYFFRTIGENEHYKQVYLHLFQELEWHRIAALTEDGQKYTEYISSMGDLFQANNINFIANMKFPRESKESSLTRYLEDLKGKHSKIIIADIYDGIARIVMCQAHKLDMTAKQGYVWFLPAWLPTKWYNTTHYNKYFNETVDCSIDTMLEAINGHFSLNHAAFGPNDSIMQENISVKVWRDKYKNHVDKWFNTSTNREFNPYLALNNNDFTSEYAGYAYDAVWIYALAIEELLKKHPESLSGIHSNDVTLKLVDIISQIDFNGVSGKIKFYGGPSRFSVINIIQWINEKSVVVGSFHPNISTVRPEVIGGILDLSKSNIVWLTPDGLIPEDGTLALNSCLLEPVATYLQISCENAVILVNVLSFTVLGIFLTIMVILLKRRYDKKIKMNEEYMKYMKAIGFDKNNGMNLTNLDKWETARECVVLNRKLGEGAFGTVFGGEAILSEGKGWVAVAVKTLKVGSDRDEKLDFLSEAESMKRFEHKNIVKLLGVCTKNEPFYTIMEFMLYGDLKTYLLARRHLINEPYTDEKEEISGKKLTSMALDIARALSYLAELKYVHRDVACRNCLVNAQRVVKLGDFGMTRLIFENDYYRFSRKGMLPVRWMAPESLGLGIFTPASDVWSFAVLLYEIITFGSFPFQGLSNNEVLEHVKIGRTITIPSGIKPQLEGLMKSCWNLDYRTRPHASEIAEFLANSPRLLSPCLDVPLASVEIDFSGELDIPEVLNRHTNPNVIEEENDISDVSVLNSLHFDNPSYITADLNTNLGAAKKAKYNKHTYEDELTTGKCDIEEIVPFV